MLLGKKSPLGYQSIPTDDLSNFVFSPVASTAVTPAAAAAGSAGGDDGSGSGDEERGRAAEAGSGGGKDRSRHGVHSRSRTPPPAAPGGGSGIGSSSGIGESSHSHSHNSNSSSSSSSNSSSKFASSLVLYALMLAICALSAALFAVHNQLTAQVHSLGDSVDTLHRHSQERLLSLSDTLQRVEANSTHAMQDAHFLLEKQCTRIAVLEGTVTRLSNRTTNADVIDRVQVTQDALHARMQEQSAAVTLQLQEAHADFQQQLSKSQTDLNQTEAVVTNKMQATLKSVDTLISQAASDVRAAQMDVASKLKAMQDLLANTLLRINNDISIAESKINKDVELLQANVDAYVEVTNKQFAQEDDFVKYQLAGTFTLLSCLISLWHMSSHLRHYYKPEVQRRIMAVLWMVPVYSTSSWLSLVLTEYAEVFGGLRDCYEAYAVYTFIAMLIAILEDGQGPRVFLRTLTQHVAHEREQLQVAVR